MDPLSRIINIPSSEIALNLFSILIIVDIYPAISKFFSSPDKFNKVNVILFDASEFSARA